MWVKKLGFCSLVAICVGCGAEGFLGLDVDAQEPVAGEFRSGAFLPARNQCFQIVGGLETMDYPAVVHLGQYTETHIVSRCTGTVVGRDTVITAAHCLSDAPNGRIALLRDRCDQQKTELIRAERAIHHGLTREDFTSVIQAANATGNLDRSALARDLAVVIFPEGSTDIARAIAAPSLSVGDTLTMVGFGIEYLASDPRAQENLSFVDTKKRYGTNTVTDESLEISDEQMVMVVQDQAEIANRPLGTYALTAEGDSGGPLFHNERLIAVTSSGIMVSQGSSSRNMAAFTSLGSALSRSLLERAFAEGADFVGWADYLEP